MYFLYVGSMANEPKTYGTLADARAAGETWALDEFHDANYWIERVE